MKHEKMKISAKMKTIRRRQEISEASAANVAAANEAAKKWRAAAKKTRRKRNERRKWRKMRNRCNKSVAGEISAKRQRRKSGESESEENIEEEK